MSRQSETPTTRAGASTTQATTPKAGLKSTRPGRPTQRQQVLALLLDGWTCGSVFYASHLPRATARIHELRQDGYYIPRRRCQNAAHNHRSTQWEWRVEAVPTKPENEACEACGGIAAHVSDCRARDLETSGRLPGLMSDA